MNASWLAVWSILVNSSWSSAVTPLPCRFSTNARGVVPLERFGTCTITVRVNPLTFSDSVVEPGEVVDGLARLADQSLLIGTEDDPQL